jgi:purine-nucleoside phosphorylase
VPQSPAFTHCISAASEIQPRLAIVFGSGMGHLASRLTTISSVAFSEIPDLAAASVPGHRGQLTLGLWADTPVLVFEGRLHFYEGHPWNVVTEPIRIAARLGTQIIVLTNAAGGIRDGLGPGSLMAIQDHIDWTRKCCWKSPPSNTNGSPYSRHLLQLLGVAAEKEGIALQQGTYAAVTGPNYETPAEIRGLRALGTDAVGMSTVREIEAGYELGLECAAISCITNRAAGLSVGPINHHEVLSRAAEAADRTASLLEAFLPLANAK